MDQTKYNLRKRKKKVNYNHSDSSESDLDSDPDYDPEYESTDNENMKEMDHYEYRKFLQKMFPSKYSKKKTREAKKEKSRVAKKEKSRAAKKEKSREVKKEKSRATKKEKSREAEKELKVIDDEKIEYSSDENELQNEKINIVFTIGGHPNDGYSEEGSDTYDADSESENETPSKKYKKGEIVEVQLKDWEDSYIGTIVKINKNNTYKIYFEEEGSTWNKIKPCYIQKNDNYDETLEEMNTLSKIKQKKGSSAMLEKFQQLAKALSKKREKEKKQSETGMKYENYKNFKQLLKNKNTINEFDYFKKLSLENQETILNKLKEINNYSNPDKPHRLKIIESDIPLQYKSRALKKLDALSFMDTGSGEYYKMHQWVDTFMTIPFNKYKQLPINMESGTELCQAFMENAKDILDKAVYGLEDAKMQIMQVLGQMISNPTAIGTSIAIKGPPGTGKTTLIKEGVSQILNRPFAFLALGGATDSSFLEGHSYTYEGAVWGKIVDILITSKCMNPVIYFDELDKISETPKGEEITGILTHLTDTTQNDKFHDKYFSNIDFNLNKALFIFSYNDEKKVNPILKDRMYRIETKGYSKKQKIIIAKDFLIPKIEMNVNFQKDQITINESALEYLIENYTENEKGVRNLKRGLEIIYTKLNLYRLMKPDSSLFKKEKVLEVSFPFEVTNAIIVKLIKKGENDIPFGLYM